ncbi:ABC transporter permease, partial [Xanthomonas hortorum pv. gardneri]
MQTKWKNRLVNLMSVVLLAVGLGVWIALPWIGVLVLAVVLAVWLVATRSGRLS